MKQVAVFHFVLIMISGQELELKYQPAMTSDSRQFYCLNKPLLFTCTGPGTAIRWDVPLVFTGRGFISVQSPPKYTLIDGGDGVNATLHLNQSTPSFVTTLTMQGVSNITVTCSTDAPATETMSLTNSSTIPPMVENVILAASVHNNSAEANITWTSTSGAFDLRHYRIHLCACNICMNFTSKTNFFKLTQQDLPIGSLDTPDRNCSVFSSVSAESHCGEIGEAGRSNEVLVSVNEVTSTAYMYTFNSGRHVVLGTGVAMAAAIIAFFLQVY